jgi:hypothetical protein
MRWRTVLRRFLLVSATLWGLAVLVLVVAFATWPWRARHTLGFNLRINLPPGYHGCPDLRFNVPGAPPTRAEGPNYVIDLPADGRWYTSTNLSWGESIRFEFFRPTQTGFVKVDGRVARGGTIESPDGAFQPHLECID